jgi:cellobiose transport system permease protein
MCLLTDVGRHILYLKKGRKRMSTSPKRRGKVEKHNKWGYIFLIPFVVVYVIFQLIPLISTIYNSFYENYRSGLIQVGPNFVGLDNYKELFAGGYFWLYLRNTLIMWVLGFVPQIIVSLILGAWFSDMRLNLKCSRFFKTVIYLPNLIMASAFSMLFFALFADTGPVNAMLQNAGVISEAYSFLSHKWSARGLVAFMNFLMWFGNTTILLMAGMMGIDPSLFEAAEVDGATSTQVFWQITMPLLRPIMVYVLVTSLIGGLQMFDVPQILTNGTGQPTQTTMTLIMYLNKHLFSKNYGMAGALSVVMFIITGILSLIVFKAFAQKKEA